MITGCLDKETLQVNGLKELNILKLNVSTLKENSVKNLPELERLFFRNNSIEILENAALVDLPKLKQISFEGNYIREIPEKAFVNVNAEVLDFTSNEIDFISSLAFRNMTNLKIFYGSHNKIQQYARDWFSNSFNLKEIHLDVNKLRTIPRRAFYKNKYLTTIDLSFNDIDVIDEDAFEGLSSLDFLNLHYNRLKVLDDRIFPRRLIIKWLYIDGNKLNYLSEEIFDKITVKDIYLYGNPWKCACLKSLENKLYKKNVNINKSFLDKCIMPLCVAPKIYNDQCFKIYDEESTQYFYEQISPSKPQLIKFNCVRFD